MRRVLSHSDNHPGMHITCYRLQTKFAKVMFLHLSVILFTGGVPGQVHPPWDQVHPPWAGTPWAGTPLGRYTSRDQVHPPAGIPPDQVHPPGQEHPPGPDQPPRTRYTTHRQCMLGDTGNKRAVRILLECILVKSKISRQLKMKEIGPRGLVFDTCSDSQMKLDTRTRAIVMYSN